MLGAVRINQAFLWKKQPVRTTEQGFKDQALDFAIQHMVKLESIAEFELLIQVVLLAKFSRSRLQQPNLGIFVGKVERSRIHSGRNDPTNLIDYMLHAGKGAQQPVTAIFRAIVGMQSVGILHHHVVVTLGRIQGFSHPLRRKIKSNIPAWIYISRKGKVKQISMPSPKKGCHFRKWRFGIVKPPRRRVLEVQVVGIKARAQTDLFGQPKVDWLGSRANVTQVLVFPSGLGNWVVAVKIIE